MNYSKNYYSILELPDFSSEEEIKAGFRRLAKKYHPDKNLDKIFAEKKFKEINEAYSFLSNPENKSNYDYYLHQQNWNREYKEQQKHKEEKRDKEEDKEEEKQSVYKKSNNSKTYVYIDKNYDEMYVNSIFKVLLLSIFSFGMYNYYWMYKQWGYISKVYKIEISPFFRSFVFTYFYIYSLFKKINQITKLRGNEFLPWPILMTLYFVITTYFTFEIATKLSYIIFLFVYSIPIIMYQSFLNIMWLKKFPDRKIPSNLTLIEFLFGLIGYVILFHI